MLSLSDQDSPVRPGVPEISPEPDWRRELRLAFRSPRALCEHLKLPPELGDPAADSGFPLLAPRPFVARMRPGDPADPLLLQVLPRPEESQSEALPADAVGDLPSQRANGLLHKYRGRALLMAAGGCAVNCRYCFRRHFPYGATPKSDAAWDPAIEYLQSDPTVSEVILSGGDPLILGDARLERLVARLADIPHLRRLRIHSRLPIVIPQRVTDPLCDLIARLRLRVVVVLHTNHANEIDDAVSEAVDELRRAGAMVLNQSVLLRGVNDNLEALVALSERLVDIGVTPYYLHQLDMVAGVRHFESTLSEGAALVESMRRCLPGYAVPRFVQEQAGEPYKTLLA
ncbi:L-lysine 2,3-aminomutase [Botrimarina colliarenosi]|uniref:L-lysine 2,3-aminomutase n=1 Tax=Botrimarina colliarenosi TaxID=2528001 RepID=A0A5C6ABM3_9BACT|nr:EF-P beta-lysylation protein EpmB [Botrimarina colliarenosi]TWT96777.1 L-lysine 2,3-aminomutase [Botrimarina colliarenosi]